MTPMSMVSATGRSASLAWPASSGGHVPTAKMFDGEVPRELMTPMSTVSATSCSASLAWPASSGDHVPTAKMFDGEVSRGLMTPTSTVSATGCSASLAWPASSSGQAPTDRLSLPLACSIAGMLFEFALLGQAAQGPRMSIVAELFIPPFLSLLLLLEIRAIDRD